MGPDAGWPGGGAVRNLFIALAVTVPVVAWALFEQRRRDRTLEALRRMRQPQPVGVPRLRFHTIPRDGETVMVGETVFTFRSEPVQPGDVLIGGSIDECYANWHEAVRPFFPGVPPLR